MAKSNLITKKQLSPDQQAGLIDMMEFVRSPVEKEMVLCGAAGTGKTSLLNVFLKEVTKEFHLKYYCTAFTNEAVRVLSMRSGKEYDKTISGLLGLKLRQYEDKGKILVREGPSYVEKYDLIVIDEASMINDELFVMIRSVMASYPRIKVLYVGDDAQLPPVKYEYSVVFRAIPHVFKLNKVMRVAEDNPIINLVTPIRERLGSSTDLFVREDSVNANNEGVHFYNMKPPFFASLLADFRSDEYQTNRNFCRLLAYTNNAVDASNAYIRRELFGSGVEEFTVHDDLIVTESYNVKVVTGGTMPIYNVGERLEVKCAERKVDPVSGITYWSLLVDNYNANVRKRHDRFIKVVAREGWQLYNIRRAELIKSCRKLASEVDPKTNQKKYTSNEAWSAFYDFISEYCYVTYAYAMTVHKAQGSTIDNVYVVENDINVLDWSMVERNKLKYTAFTRASKNLHIYCR